MSAPHSVQILQAAQALEPVTLSPITREQLREYAQASGDFNPIHLDEEVAKKNGLPGIIAHGMLIAGFIAERGRAAAAGSGGSWTLVRLQNRFRAMTFLGDTLSIGGAVKSVSETSLVLDLQARNQKGEVVTTGVASFERR
jgi:acyl dehydratase